MTLSLLNILSIIILFQLALLIFFLITSKQGKRISNILLAGFFSLLLINLGDGLLSFYGIYTNYPAFAHLEDGFVFLLGPVLYFYTRSLIFKDFSFSIRDHLHIVPFVLITIAYQIFYHLQPESYQRFIQEAIVNRELPPGFYFSLILIYGHVCVYIILALRELAFYREKIREQFSAVGKVNLSWLTFMLYSVGMILVVSLLYTILPVIGLQNYFEGVFALAFVFLFFFINGVMWKGLRQPEIFSGISAPTTTGSAREEKKYVGSTLADQERRDIAMKLDILMHEKVFLNPDLTLDDLASKIGYTPKKVSQVINETFNQNFFDFVNTRRIGEAEYIMRTSADPKITVLEVMYACGFNSKSSFNTIFKQKTGMTPSEFKKAVLQAHVSSTRI